MINSKRNEAINLVLRELSIRYVGNPDYGNHLQERARQCGWDFYIQTQQCRVHDVGACDLPDLVILEGFPESLSARSAYYRLSQLRGIKFLALNASPHTMKLFHMHALSHIRLIDRDPEPEALIEAVLDLTQSRRNEPARHAGMFTIESPSPICKSMRHCAVQDISCC